LDQGELQQVARHEVSLDHVRDPRPQVLDQPVAPVSEVCGAPWPLAASVER
jgi:hypothetical protein